MSKRKRKERMSEPSTQLSITEFMLPKIKLEPADKDEEKKIKLEFEDKEKDKNSS